VNDLACGSLVQFRKMERLNWGEEPSRSAVYMTVHIIARVQIWWWNYIAQDQRGLLDSAAEDDLFFGRPGR